MVFAGEQLLGVLRSGSNLTPPPLAPPEASVCLEPDLVKPPPQSGLLQRFRARRGTYPFPGWPPPRFVAIWDPFARGCHQFSLRWPLVLPPGTSATWERLEDELVSVELQREGS